MQHAPCLHCVACVFVALHFRPLRKSGQLCIFAKGSMLNMCKPTKSQTKVQEGERDRRERVRERERRVRICGKFVAWEMQIAIAELSERTISMALIKQARFELISKWATPLQPLYAPALPPYSY